VGRVVDEERDMRDLLVQAHPVLGPEVVLAQQEAVVGAEHERRVAPEVVLVEEVQHAAQQEVAQGHHRVVVGAELLALVGSSSTRP
jgi:hypothetical protein